MRAFPYFRETITAIVLLLIVLGMSIVVGKARQFGCSRVPEGTTWMGDDFEPGKRMLVHEMPPVSSSYRPGTVIVYHAPGARPDEPLELGRVVAMAGQVVSVEDGQFRIDGKKASAKLNTQGLDPFNNLLVPEGHVLVGFEKRRAIDLHKRIVPLLNIKGKVNE